MSVTQTPQAATEPKPRPADGTSSTLVVRNLPSTTTSADFSSFFTAIAAIQHAFVVTKKADQGVLCEGFGFVTFADKSDAINLVKRGSIPWKVSFHKLSIRSDDTSSTLVVRNLPSTTTSADFSSFFTAIAAIQHAFVVTKKADQGVLCEGFGFVTFADKSDAINLVKRGSIPWKDSSQKLSL